MVIATSAATWGKVCVVREHTNGTLVEAFEAAVKVPCFLGLSPRTSYLGASKLTAVLTWLIPRCSRLIIIEGSFVARWNLAANGSLREDEVRRAAGLKHQRARQRLARVLRNVPGSHIASVMDWTAEIEKCRFQALLSSVKGYFACNAKFKEMIEAIVSPRIARRPASRPQYRCPEKGQILRQYVFEEIAMFLHLYGLGYWVEVYPGHDLPILQMIGTGAFPDFPVSCPLRTHISIRLERSDG